MHQKSINRFGNEEESRRRTTQQGGRPLSIRHRHDILLHPFVQMTILVNAGDIRMNLTKQLCLRPQFTKPGRELRYAGRRFEVRDGVWTAIGPRKRIPNRGYRKRVNSRRRLALVLSWKHRNKAITVNIEHRRRRQIFNTNPGRARSTGKPRPSRIRTLKRRQTLTLSSSLRMPLRCHRHNSSITTTRSLLLLLLLMLPIKSRIRNRLALVTNCNLLLLHQCLQLHNLILQAPNKDCILRNARP